MRADNRNTANAKLMCCIEPRAAGYAGRLLLNPEPVGGFDNERSVTLKFRIV